MAVAALMGALAAPSRSAFAETAIAAIASAAVAFHLTFSVQPLQSLRTAAPIAAGLMAGLFCARAGGGDGRARRAAWIGLAAAGTVLSIHGLWQAGAGFERLASVAADLPDPVRARLQAGRAVATLGLPGALAGFLILSIPITASLVAEARAARRMPAAAGAVAAALLQAAALIATRSPAAIGALGAAAALVTWSRARTPAGRRAALAALAAGTALAAGILAWRLLSPAFALEGAGPLALRAGNWKAGLAMVADRPLFGGGLGTFGILFPAYRGWGMNESRFAHNTWLQIGAEAGIPAALAAVALTIWLVARLVRGRKDPGPGQAASFAAAIACTAFVVHNAADFTFYLPSVALPFFCLAGFSLGRGAREHALRGGAPAARLALCAALALFALWLSRADAQRDTARELAQDGPSEAAIGAAHEAVRMNPFDPGAHDLYARLLLARAAAAGDATVLETAETHALRAVDLDESTPGHWNLLGRVRLARSDPQGAYIALHRAAQLYPIRIEYRQDRDAVAAMLAPESPEAPEAKTPPGRPADPAK
jgi:hypothetical protein